MKNIYLYARFERLWHWLQTLLIIILLLTGFEVYSAFSLFGFGTSVEVHNFAGLTWLIAFAFFVFWIFTTGHTILAHTRAMITGWEEVADEESAGDWEYKTKAVEKERGLEKQAPSLSIWRFFSSAESIEVVHHANSAVKVLTC